MRTFERALRRSGLPLRMSEGYNPRPRISLPVPLGVGIEGTDEAMEFDLADWVPDREVTVRLREQLPAGLRVLSAELAPSNRAARAETIAYRISLRKAISNEGRLTREGLERFMARDEVLVQRIRKGHQKIVNIRPFIIDLQRKDEDVLLRLKAGPEGSASPWEVLAAIGCDEAVCRSQFRIVRTRVQLASE